MDTEGFAKVKELFGRALALPEAERQQWLVRECADSFLRAEVAELLAHSAAAATGFLAHLGSAERGRAALVHLSIPGFARLELLDAGGSGVVYRAEQTSPRREVAIKVLRLDSLAAGQVARFQREAEILGSLAHPGIAQVFGAGVVETDQVRLPWIAMEFVRGSTLGEHVAARQPDTRTRLELFMAVCEAVEHAHKRGIVHRDLKPTNVMVDVDGRPKVLDFGVARSFTVDLATAERTRTGTVVGTLAYMAPEQARGEREVDARADVYALGVMLFELMTGRLPLALDGVEVLEGVRRVCLAEPERLRRLRPELPEDLETIVAKALEKEPARRYASAGELAADLANLLAERPVRARRPTAVYQAKKFVRRNRALAISAAAVFTALASGLLLALLSLRAEHAQRALTSETVDFFAGKIFDFAPQLGFGEEQRDDFEEVLQRIDGQLEVDPHNRALRAARADALYELATLDQARNDHVRTRERAQEARALREELVREDPHDLSSWTHLSQLYAKLGEAARDLDDPAGRDEWFARALELDERLVREHPGDLELVEDLGWSLCRMVESARRRQDHAEAARLAHRRLADGLELVRAEPDNWKYVYNLSHAQIYVATIASEEQRPEEALEHARESVRLARRLCELQPNRRDFLIWRASACRSARLMADNVGDTAQTCLLAEEALALAVEVAYRDPLRHEHLQGLRLAASEAAYVDLRLGRMEAARGAVERMRQAGEVARNAGGPATPVALLEAAADLVGARVERQAGNAQLAQSLEVRGLTALLELALTRDTSDEELGLCRGILSYFLTNEETGRRTPLVLEFCQRLRAGGEPERALWFASQAASDLDDAGREALRAFAEGKVSAAPQPTPAAPR